MFNEPENKFVFIHTPKCAGSSIHVWFKDHYNLIDRTDPLPLEHHITWNDFLENTPHKDIFGFSFVRNPWDRVVSAFFDPFLQTPAEDFDQFVSTILPDMLQKIPTHESIHFFPAVYFTVSPKRDLDFIGKHENLREDMSILSEKIGVSLKIGHHRTSSRPKSRHKEMYNSNTKNVIKMLYAQDIERFEYEF